MIILGIDPGSVTTGYAFLDTEEKIPKVLEYGVLHAPESLPLEDRLLHIVRELEQLLDIYQPQELSMEGVFFYKNPKSALVLGHIRGAVLVACRRRGMNYSEYPPTVVKQSVTGKGSASKELVASMVFTRLGIERGSLPLDASDALAIALTHANPAPLATALVGAAGLTRKKINGLSRKKKATAKQWKDLIEKMGGTIQ
ncbi:MAG: crossover junction endodeoxyribonuclease RuvC [Fibrobacter sp.]|nr:crossover junction endodeoxyribonuclease RuvC [Fibrobacter sp.]